ncbi:MAG TPA: hypothetical protein PLL20_19565 [Phycisphaerae bacterium]|nr:hypothetical protein [Phycisphaerae bacterium]HRR84729.1 hypothetical protein [Phycisphaerae bacterium]
MTIHIKGLPRRILDTEDATAGDVILSARDAFDGGADVDIDDIHRAVGCIGGAAQSKALPARMP